MSETLTLPTDMVADAVEAYDRYRYAVEHDLLIQGGWHRESGGRHLACALGVLGGEVQGSRDCPAHVMPRWLALMVPRMFDVLDFEDAKAWGMKLYEQLARLRGEVPFTVIYDWQATCVLEFWSQSLRKRKFDAATLAEKLAAVETLRALHHKHLAGGAAPKAEWHEALRKADAYADAYAYAYAYADAYAYAYAYADAYAYAYAYADADAYADAEPSPKTATAEDRKAAYERKRRENLTLLSNGLVEALARVPTPAQA